MRVRDIARAVARAVACAAALWMAGPPGARAQAPLRIGVMNDQSGPYSDVTGRGSVIGAELAVEEFGGKVLGRPIEIVIGDHQNKPDIAATSARKWFDVDGVQAIFDMPHSAAMLAVLEIARERKKIIAISGGLLPDVTGRLCGPTIFHWAYDSYALARTIGSTLVKLGGDTWYFITLDSAGGHALEKDASRFVEEAGGKVVGAVRHPLGTPDFSSYLLQAQSRDAKVVAAANAGRDTVNTIKQAGEYGMTSDGRRVAGLLVLINDVHAMGLPVARGVVAAESYYWDLDEDSRRFAERFRARSGGVPPNMIQAGVYSSVLHYLKAVRAAGTDEGLAVGAKMRELKVDDAYTHGVAVRGDGRVMRDMHVFEVKSPAEAKGPWDYYKLLATVSGEQAFRSVAEGGCPTVASR